MKFAMICLFACIAVSQAAFSANLVQRAQPMMAQAIFKARLASSRGPASRDMQTELIAQLQEQANAILNQIQNGVDMTQETIANLQAQFAETQSQISALVSNVGGNISDIVSGLLGGLGSIWGSIFGNKGMIGDLFASGLAQAQEWLNNLVSQLDLSTLLQSVIGQIVGNNKGIFGDLWSSITDVTSSAWNNLVEMATSIFGSAAASFANIQQVAAEFVANAMAEGQQISAQAAQQLLEFLRPYQQDLGVLWDQVVAQVSAITGTIVSRRF
jgi:predicted PurR-regulated permease PerM